MFTIGWFRAGRPLVDQLVKYVALAGFPAGLADAALDLVEREVMHRAGRGDDVLLDHQAAHVVGPEEQRDLADLRPLRHPRGLDVRDVVEVKPGDGLGAEELERPRRRASCRGPRP